MYDIVILFHYWTSSIFFIIALIVTIWAIAGWVKSKKYSPAFNKLSFVFILFLYIQLLTGIVLYFFLKPQNQSVDISLEQAALQSSLRFWAIEHVSLMLFAFLLAQIGRHFIKQLTTERKKFRAATFYFGLSFLVVLTSSGMALFR